MPPIHHPRPEALADFLLGNCSPGAALLITGHTERCMRCAGRMRAMGAVAGSAAEVVYGEPRPLAPELEATPVLNASGLGEAVFHLKLAPRCELPIRNLLVAEILVLEGGLKDDTERYGPGDLLSLEAKPVCRLVSHATKGCACLVTAHDPPDDEEAT